MHEIEVGENEEEFGVISGRAVAQTPISWKVHSLRVMNWFQVTQCPYFECSGDDITVESTHVTGLPL